MSSIYIQEPPTNGKVLLKTSIGDIDIELWSKETPKACQNFVQLCMEEYYNNTIFHRVVKGFIAQGGDPSGTGTGGESVYGKTFKDEFHQRLKFNRRGLVAMANAGTNDNGSQFFFTLDRADELNKKHTIFGKVTGNTIYNMIRFNDLDVDENDRPLAPPKIFSTEVLSNPFDDIVPRKVKGKTKVETSTKVKSKSKATKNFKLLSFGEEAEIDEEETNQISEQHKIASSHDVLNDPRLSSQPAVEVDPVNRNAIDDHVTEKIRRKLKRDEMNQKNSAKVADEHANSKDDAKNKRRKELQEEAKRLKRELRPKPVEILDDSEDEEKDPINDLMVELTNERKAHLKRKHEDTVLKKGGNRETETLELLASFTSKLNDANVNNEEDDVSWLNHTLNFEGGEKSAKDANMKDEDWYDIYDPRNPLNQRRREKFTMQENKKTVK